MKRIRWALVGAVVLLVGAADNRPPEGFTALFDGKTLEGWKVPEVLLSGDHARIEAWRRREALRATWQKRPDLLEGLRLGKSEKEFLKELGWKAAGKGKTTTDKKRER